MSYTTVASVKTMLGEIGTGSDAIIAQLISDSDVYLNTQLRIDGFDYGTYTEQVEMKNTAQVNVYNKIYLKNFNVQSIVSINGQPYTGALGIDYQFEYSRTVLMRDFYKYIVPSGLYFNFFPIVYTAGRARTPIDLLPKDIELMERLLVVGLYNQKYPMGYSAQDGGIRFNEGVSNYKLGDESITIKANSQKDGKFESFRSPEERNQFLQIFSKYLKANVIG